MNLLINPEDKVSFEVYVAVNGDQLYANADKNVLLKENKDVKEEDVVSFNFTFKKPSYGDNMSIMKKCGGVTTNGETIEFDASAIRYERFVSLLDSWTLVDEDAKPLPTTKDNIDRLHPTLAGVILDEMEKLVS